MVAMELIIRSKTGMLFLYSTVWIQMYCNCPKDYKFLLSHAVLNMETYREKIFIRSSKVKGVYN